MAKRKPLLDRWAFSAQHWIGTPSSLIVHTILFITSIISIFFGVKASTMLLVLTTFVSLEAIYLSIFIQMAVNHQGRRLKNVEEDVDDILEDTADLTEEEKKKIKKEVKKLF